MRTKLAVLLIASGVMVTALLWLLERVPATQESDPSSRPGLASTSDATTRERNVAVSEPTRNILANPDDVGPGANEASALFEEVNPEKLDQNTLDEFLNARPAVRFRAVTVNADLLRTTIRDTSDDGSITMRLFDDVVLPLDTLQRHEYVDGQFSGHATWIARVSTDPASTAQLMIDPAGFVDASIRSAAGTYKVESLGQSQYHIIWQRDPHISVDIH